MWFWFALIAILFWSGSDLFSKMGSHEDDPYSHWKLVMTVGGVMGLHAIVMLILARIPGIESVVGEAMAAELPTNFSLMDIITYLPASACYILSMILGYVGLRYLVLSVSTPICNSSGALVAILCYVLLGETMDTLSVIGVAIICVGVFLLSYLENKEERAIEKKEGKKGGIIAVAFPLLYCLIDALGTFIDGFLLIETDEAGNVISGVLEEAPANIAYELTFLFMAIVAFVYVVIIRRQSFTFSKEKPKMIAGVCETAGQLAYVYALAANTQVAAPMISSYCLFSVLWARLILKEKLSWKKYAVIGLAVVGIILLGIAEEL